MSSPVGSEPHSTNDHCCSNRAQLVEPTRGTRMLRYAETLGPTSKIQQLLGDVYDVTVGDVDGRGWLAAEDRPQIQSL